MQAAVRSWRLAGLAYLTLPSALLGGVVALLLLGDGLTVGTGAGLLAVFVLAVRNTLTTLDANAHGDGDRASDRFGPVVTSSVAIAAVMLPFAVLGSRVGLEILQPLSIVVLGGLITSALHALLVVPALDLAVPRPTSYEDDEILQPAPAAAASEEGGR